MHPSWLNLWNVCYYLLHTSSDYFWLLSYPGQLLLQGRCPGVNEMTSCVHSIHQVSLSAKVSVSAKVSIFVNICIHPPKKSTMHICPARKILATDSSRTMIYFQWPSLKISFLTTFTKKVVMLYWKRQSTGFDCSIVSSPCDMVYNLDCQGPSVPVEENLF